MIHAEITEKSSDVWLNVPVVEVGECDPAFSVLVSVNDEPQLRLLVNGSSEPECMAFQETLVWQSYVVIGMGHRVHLFSLEDHSVRTIDLGDYFGHLYALDASLLVASGMRLFCLDASGEIVWTSEELAVDGVIVHDVSDDIISGDAEHDPPGDWRPFQVRLSDGIVIENTPDLVEKEL